MDSIDSGADGKDSMCSAGLLYVLQGSPLDGKASIWAAWVQLRTERAPVRMARALVWTVRLPCRSQDSGVNGKDSGQDSKDTHVDAKAPV